jgi:hypothetical protein
VGAAVGKTMAVGWGLEPAPQAFSAKASEHRIGISFFMDVSFDKSF